jgi:hypothetical protein
VDRALGETRQHEIALKNIVAELRHAGRPATAAGATPVAGGARRDEVKEAAPVATSRSIAGILGSARG